MTSSSNNYLLGFGATGDDEDFEGGRGRGRGGSGGRDQGAREPSQGGRKGRGGRLAIDDNDFPTL